MAPKLAKYDILLIQMGWENRESYFDEIQEIIKLTKTILKP
jgi:hypothetical protein